MVVRRLHHCPPPPPPSVPLEIRRAFMCFPLRAVWLSSTTTTVITSTWMLCEHPELTQQLQEAHYSPLLIYGQYLWCFSSGVDGSPMERQSPNPRQDESFEPLMAFMDGCVNIITWFRDS